MLTLQRLQALKAVGEEGSFTKAAEKLLYSQSAVSQHIAALESYLSVPLVNRQRPPGSIRYHFDTKQGLFKAVLKRGLTRIDRERLIRLDELEANSANNPSSLADLFGALIDPVLDLAAQGSRGRQWLQLLARSRIEPGGHWRMTRDMQRRMLDRFQMAFQMRLDGLPEKVVQFRLAYLLGSITVGLIDIEALRHLGVTPTSLREHRETVRARLMDMFIAAMAAGTNMKLAK